MERNIVFDLEHTLIGGIKWIGIHPEAEEVLKRSKREFDNILLWTLCKAEEGIKAMKEHNLLDYFDGIIGLELLKNPTRVYTTLCRFINGKETERQRFGLTTTKDLSLLGNPNEFVLIENKPTYGKPLSRIIEITPYQFQKDHSLLEAYERALRKF